MRPCSRTGTARRVLNAAVRGDRATAGRRGEGKGSSGGAWRLREESADVRRALSGEERELAYIVSNRLPARRLPRPRLTCSKEILARPHDGPGVRDATAAPPSRKPVRPVASVASACPYPQRVPLPPAIPPPTVVLAGPGLRR